MAIASRTQGEREGGGGKLSRKILECHVVFISVDNTAMFLDAIYIYRHYNALLWILQDWSWIGLD